MDIVSFVERHFSAYRNHFLMNTLYPVEGDQFIVRAADDSAPGGAADPRFADYKIAVSFSLAPHSRAWATNVIEERAHGYRGFILVCKDLLNEEVDFRKFVLAEEWLEVMMGFNEPRRRKRERQVADRIDLVDLYNQMGRATLWSDDDEDKQQLHIGLQHLLLPERVIEEFTKKYFKKSLAELRTYANKPEMASEAGRLIKSIERGIAAREDVDIKLAQLRVYQTVFDHPCPD